MLIETERLHITEFTMDMAPVGFFTVKTPGEDDMMNGTNNRNGC